MGQASRNRIPHFQGVVLIVALVFPTLVTWVYFVALAESAPILQQMAYGIGKVLQFSLPAVAVWLGWVRLQPLGSRDPEWNRAEATSGDVNVCGSRIAPAVVDWGAAIGFGLLVGGMVFGLYLGYLGHSEMGEKLASTVSQKIQRFGINQAWQFAALGIFYSLGHSGLEEYYWRWFVFRGLAAGQSNAMAILVSSAGFMAHHVLLLATFLGWDEPLMWLASFGVGIGGAFWAWLYSRTRRLRFPWLSHLLVDAAIFGLGYLIWSGSV